MVWEEGLQPATACGGWKWASLLGRDCGQLLSVNAAGQAFFAHN